MSITIRPVIRGAAIFFFIATTTFGANQATAYWPFTINFDDVIDKTDIRTHYQPGVTFSCEGVKCPLANEIYARQTNTTASIPNSVTPIQNSSPGVGDDVTGRVVATFRHAVQSVSIDARATQVPEPLNRRAYANITAYDANGMVLGSATGTQYGVFETLTVAAQNYQIAKVSLGVTGPQAVAVFDNLQYHGLLFAYERPAWAVIIVTLLVVSAYYIRRKMK